MEQTVIILGRQPGLGLAELESRFGPDKLRPFGKQAVLIKADNQLISIARFGGLVKVAKLLTILPTTQWTEIETYLLKTISEHLQYVPEGKFQLGLSAYGLPVRPDRINATGLSLKKVIKATGRPVRIIPNKTADLNAAQIIHNKLTSRNGWELILCSDGRNTALALTTQVQDIEAYAARDQVRPKRDARVGMLPPKLAQIIINLADKRAITDQVTINTKPTRLLDPFVGTGVVLQEAMLMGYDGYGTDFEPRMIDYSMKNLEWLIDGHNINQKFELAVADATSFTWQNPIELIATETYLGRPFTAPPEVKVLDEVIEDVDTIHKKFLLNVARQTSPGFRMCLAVPAWKTASGFRHLPSLASLEKLGYNRLGFKHVRNDELIYYRPEQFVGRELLVLVRK